MSILRARLQGSPAMKDRHHAMIIIGAIWNEISTDVRKRVFDIDDEDLQDEWDDLSENDREATCCNVFLELFPDDDTSFLLADRQRNREMANSIKLHPEKTLSMQKFVERLQDFDPYGRRDKAAQIIGEVWDALDTTERREAFADIEALAPEYASCHLSSWSELYGTSYRADVVLKVFDTVYDKRSDKSTHGFPLYYRSARNASKYEVAPQYMLALYEFEPMNRRGEAKEIIGKTWDQISPAERAIGIPDWDSVAQKCELTWDQLGFDQDGVCQRIFCVIFGDHRSPFEDSRAYTVFREQEEERRIEQRKQMAEHVSAATLESFNTDGPELVLKKDQSIYEPETRKQIRELLQGKSVVVIDQDGVVLPIDRDHSLPHKPDDKIVATINQLAREGYSLVYWTHSSNEHGFVAETLVRAKIAQLFSLVVCNENYVAEEPDDLQHCINAIDETAWLDDETKENMRERAEQGESYDPFGGGQSFPKLPQIYMEKCLSVDDNPHWKDVLSPHDEDAYPVLEPASLHVDSDLSASDKFFGTQWVQRIKEKFPPQ